MESLAIEMRTSVRCAECNAQFPVAGLQAEAACPACATLNDISSMQWARTGGPGFAFGGYYDAVTESLATTFEDLHDARSDREVTIKLRHVALSCACGAGLEVPEKGRYVKCNACGDAVPVRWPDETTREWDRRIWCVVGDASDRVVAKEPTLSNGAVLCKSCSQPLALALRRRALACDHCGAANFIGDRVWTKLFPRPEDHAVFLVYKLDDRVMSSVTRFLAGRHPGIRRDAAVRYAKKLRDQAMTSALGGHGAIDLAMATELLARTDLTLANLETIDGWLSNADRGELVGRGPKLPPSLISRWAASDDEDTRTIAAWARGGPKPGEEDLALLAADPDPSVRFAVAARDDLGASLIEKLATDVDAGVRTVIAAREDTPPALLAKLREDADADVRAAAAR